MVKNDNKKRVDKIEQDIKPDGEPVIAVYWGDGFVTVKGERITIEEFEARYPDRQVITWDVWDD
jgi:hypothetical protein